MIPLSSNKLHNMAIRNHSTRLLIERGADVNAMNSYATRVFPGETFVSSAPLYYAAKWSTECVALLLQHGAQVNIQDDTTNETALYQACIGNNIECTELLIKNGADVNSRDALGRTILRRLKEHSAGPQGDANPRQYDDMIDLLKRHGATE